MEQTSTANVSNPRRVNMSANRPALINCFCFNFVSVCTLIKNLTALVEKIVDEIHPPTTMPPTPTTPETTPPTPTTPKGNLKKKYIISLLNI